ncbi:MAG: hypothetical protein MRY83_12015 [Flavobacteriales bacterium]|nr:hypothetical protein [Flavobacteriales bacterium]
MRLLFILLLTVSFTLIGNAQSTLRLPELHLGTSFNYQWDTRDNAGLFDEFIYQEYSLNSFLGLAYWDGRLMTGMRLGVFRNKGFSWEPWDNHYVVGPFQQIGYRTPEGNRVYLELGYNIGNLCMCGPTSHDKIEGLKMWSIGGGFQLYLGKGLSFDFGLMNYDLILGDSQMPHHNLTHLILGMKYSFLKSPNTFHQKESSVRFL